jgi:hypothetical protein
LSITLEYYGYSEIIMKILKSSQQLLGMCKKEEEKDKKASSQLHLCLRLLLCLLVVGLS